MGTFLDELVSFVILNDLNDTIPCGEGVSCFSSGKIAAPRARAAVALCYTHLFPASTLEGATQFVVCAMNETQMNIPLDVSLRTISRLKGRT